MSTIQARALLTRVRSADDEREEDKRPLDFRLIARLMEYTRPYAVKRNWLLCLVVIRAVQLPMLAWCIAAVIKGPVEQGNAAGLVQGVLGFALLAVSTQVVVHFRQRFALELGEAVVGDLRNDIFAHLQRMPMSFFHATKLGRIISRMISDVEDVRVGVQDVLFVGLVQLGQMFVAAAIMLWYDWTLFMVVLGLVPVLYAINRHFHRRLSRALRDLRESFSRVTATLAESVNGIRVTQGFVRQDTNAKLFGDLVHDHSVYTFDASRIQGMFVPLLELNNQCFVAALLVVGGYQVLSPSGHVAIGDLVGFFFMANMFFSPITNLGAQYNQALTTMAGAERIFRLLDAPPAWADAPDARPLPPVRGQVEFHSVTFSYEPSRPVLFDVSFTAKAGQTIALVGHTGSGKSTIVNLVAKFYQPDTGQVLIDGHDLREVSSGSLRRQVGLVLQQNFLFSGTVLENIRLGKPSATDGEIAEVIQRLDCLDLMTALPDGLLTQVGERGQALSLGQRQIVCFARAMLLDPKVLLLDEATSSIDTMTEARIQRALAVLLEGRTSFVVAHRLSTIRKADVVLVLDHGRIVERGTHGELLAAGGVYAGLYRRFAHSAAPR